MKALLTCLAVLLTTGPVSAGPWLRDKGAVFLSFGENILLSDGTELPVHHDPSFYVEWGAGERLTLSFNIHSGNAGQEWTAESFAILPLPVPQRWGVATASAGLAYRTLDTGETATLAGGGLAWGRGGDKGWFAIEARAMADIETGRGEGKLDITWGRHFSDRWSGVLQLQSGIGRTGAPYAKLVPSAVFQLSDSLRLSAGITQALTGDRGTGLYLGTWVDF